MRSSNGCAEGLPRLPSRQGYMLDACFYLHDGTAWSFFEGGTLDE